MSDERANDFGTAELRPNRATAGEKGCWNIQYVVGRSGIKEGGGLRIIPPGKGVVLWQIGKVIATCTNPAASLEVRTEKTYPLTYHHSNYPAINIKVYGTGLNPGDRMEIKMGVLGGYNSGRFIQTQAQTHTQTAEFSVYVDPIGNGEFSRERLRPAAYKKVDGNLEIEVLPGREHHIRVSLRSRPKPDADEIVVLAVEDQFENPIDDREYEVDLLTETGEVDGPSAVRKPRDSSGVAFNVKVSGSDVCRVGARSWRNGIYGVSNPLVPGLRDGKYRVYFGDMHVMTGSSGNRLMSGTTEEAILYARDTFGLDFTAVTNPINLNTWPRDQEIFRKYNKDHEFVTLPAYEIGFRTGHKNVYYLDESQPMVEHAGRLENLWAGLSDKKAMVISHHTNTHSETDPREGWGPLQISTINPEYERLIEICQNRGSFEKDEIGGEVHFGGFGSSIRDVLARGYRLGFVGGTDTHRGRPGSRLSNQSGLDAAANITGGITGVLAEELTRGAIWEALMQRRCYATTSTKMVMDFTLNDLLMGQEVIVTGRNAGEFSKRRLTIKAVGTYGIDRVIVVRNGREVFEEAINAMEAEVVWTDEEPLEAVADKDIRGVYYYAKVYQHDGNVGWTSPVWLTVEDQ